MAADRNDRIIVNEVSFFVNANWWLPFIIEPTVKINTKNIHSPSPCSEGPTQVKFGTRTFAPGWSMFDTSNFGTKYMFGTYDMT